MALERWLVSIMLVDNIEAIPRDGFLVKDYALARKAYVALSITTGCLERARC